MAKEPIVLSHDGERNCTWSNNGRKLRALARLSDSSVDDRERLGPLRLRRRQQQQKVLAAEAAAKSIGGGGSNSAMVDSGSRGHARVAFAGRCPGGASLNHTTHKALGPRLTLRQCLGEVLRKPFLRGLFFSVDLKEVNQVRVSRCHLFRGNGIENKDSALEEERQMITAQLGRHQTLGITQMARIRRLLRLHSLVLHGPSSSPILFHDMAAAAVIRVVVLLQRLRVLTLRCGHRLWSRRCGAEEQRRTGRGGHLTVCKGCGSRNGRRPPAPPTSASGLGFRLNPMSPSRARILPSLYKFRRNRPTNQLEAEDKFERT
ncbi:hypothetical protein BHM03_00014679 [Ensete ventricosum]|nr:hypothetical protein BHM03_00014679 [Ensete ventricosum]